MTQRLAAALLAVLALPACTAQDAPGTAAPRSPSPLAESGGAAGGTMPATAFPLTSVLLAAQESLPTGVAIGEIDRDARWLPGNRLEIPLERDGSPGVLVVTVFPERASCSAESALLGTDEATAVADEVCRVWESEGRLPVVVPDPDAPIPTDPSDAAR